MVLNFDHLKTFYSALKAKFKDLRGDWNQNDSTADGYIKNRPFYSYEKSIEILSQISVVNNDVLTLKYPLELGKEYHITFDGVEYASVASKYNGYLMLGNVGNTGEPFVVETQDQDVNGWIYIAPELSEEPHTISIKTSQTVHKKIDEKYLPEITSISSWNDLTDKPFGEIFENITFNPDTDITNDSVWYQNDLIKVSDKQLTMNELIGATITVETSGGMQTLVSDESNTFGENGIAGAVFNSYPMVITMTAKAAAAEGVEPGTYFMCIPGQVVTTSLENIKKIDEKYLPDDIAKLDQVNSLINESLGVIENGTY